MEVNGFGGKVMCPQLYPTVYGWERSDFRFGRDIDKFVILFFCPHGFCSGLEATAFEISRWNCAGTLPWGRNSYFKKNLGGRTPQGGNFFPKFFSRFRSENFRESCPLPRKKYAKKIFHESSHRGRATTPDIWCSACWSGLCGKAASVQTNYQTRDCNF